MALPNKEEQALLEAFRGNVADIVTEEESSDDMFLLRWLRARDLNLQKAEEMLRIAKKWRLENHLDDDRIIRNKAPRSTTVYAKKFPIWTDGMDKEGRPGLSVSTGDFGHWDVRKCVKEGKAHEFISYLTECFEEMSRALEVTRRMHPAPEGKPPITQVILILNWEGFAWSQLLSYQTVHNFLQIGAIYEAYYPEILYKCFFINCPSLISTVLGLLKPVIAPRTMEKIKCIGTNKEEWGKELLDLIDPKHLRPQFGGTKNDDLSPWNVE